MQHGGLPKDYEGKREEYVCNKKATMDACGQSVSSIVTENDDACSEYTGSEFSDGDLHDQLGQHVEKVTAISIDRSFNEPHGQHKPDSSVATPVSHSKKGAWHAVDGYAVSPASVALLNKRKAKPDARIGATLAGLPRRSAKLDVPAESSSSGAGSDSEDIVPSLRQRAHRASPANASGQKKLKNVSEKVAAPTAPNISVIEAMLASKAGRAALPQNSIQSQKWVMVGSRSQPNVANAPVDVPKHVVREGDGHRAGVRYKCADGSAIPNLGEVDLVHHEPDGTLHTLTFQNAPVHTTIVSVKYLVTRDCGQRSPPWWPHRVSRRWSA